jgi:hypothetical protein
MTSTRKTDPSHARTGENPTSSTPARSDIGENSSSELIEAPLTRDADPLDAHDFGDGGGGGGAEAYRRAPTRPRHDK